MYFFPPDSRLGAGAAGPGRRLSEWLEELKEMKSKKTIMGDRQLHLKGSEGLPRESPTRSFKRKMGQKAGLGGGGTRGGCGWPGAQSEAGTVRINDTCHAMISF